jgi:hypothetical protein
MKHIVNLILLILVALNIYSCRKKNELPIYSDFADIALQDPKQTPTQHPPFTAKVGNQTHTVKPLYDYHITGMVVSCGFSKNMAEYRNDSLNIMDAGIIWGNNLNPSIYKEIGFYTDGVWLHAKTKDPVVWKNFNPEQLSNNHLLCTDPQLKKQIKALKRGTVVDIKGCLVSYSGRNSSVSRTDIGDNACETIWVNEFKILRNGTKHWYRLHRASLYGIAAWFTVQILRFLRPTSPINKA